MWAKGKEPYEPQLSITKPHNLATIYNMCVLQEEQYVPTFLSIWEIAMDDETTIKNPISEDIKIALILNKLPETWGTFITMQSFEQLTKIPQTLSNRRRTMLNQ